MAHQLNNAKSGQKPEVVDMTLGSHQQNFTPAAVPSPDRPGLQLGPLPGSSPQSTPTPSPISVTVAPFQAAPSLSSHHSPPTSAGRRKQIRPRPGPLLGAGTSAQPHPPVPRVDALDQEFYKRPIGDFADVEVESGKITIHTSELQSLGLIGALLNYFSFVECVSPVVRLSFSFCGNCESRDRYGFSWSWCDFQIWLFSNCHMSIILYLYIH